MAARQLNIDKRTLTLIMKRGLIKFREENAGGNTRVMLRSEDLKQEWFARTTLLSIREAAADLGIPVSTLRELRESGEYEQTYFGPDSISYAKRDIEKSLKNYY